MIDLNHTKRFHILGQEVDLFASETAYGWQSIAEINKVYYHLGNVLINIETAILAWQDVNHKILDKDEIESVMIQNSLKQAKKPL